MGKRKIGEIYNKPIVEGDKNLVTNNEIHKSELGEGGSSWKYYDVSNIVKSKVYAVVIGSLVKTTDGIHPIGTLCISNMSSVISDSIAIAFDASKKLNFEGRIVTMGDYFLSNINYHGLTPIPITEEEFYNFN